MSDIFRENPFWNFSIEIYRRSDVSRACLALQESLGVDVNILLLCCWLAVEGRANLSVDTLAALRVEVDDWHNGVVKGLRGVRDGLKGGFAPVPDALVEEMRRRIIKAEIDCERVEQDLLYQKISQWAAPAGPANVHSAAENLKFYFSALKAVPDARDIAQLETIVLNCFPAENPGAVRLALSAAGL